MSRDQGPSVDIAPSKEEADFGELSRAAPAAPGEPSAADLAGVIEAYETPLLRYVRHLLGTDEADAEDVVQEAFLRYHRYVERRGTASVRDLTGWLFRVTHNLALDSRRREATRQKAHEGAKVAAEVGAGDSPEGLAALVRRAACERAVEELAKLPEQQRQVLLLKVIQDMRMREIAQVTGMSLGNVAYHLNQALRELARRLKAAGVI